MARGDEPADLVIRGGRVLSVFTREWLAEDIAVVDGHVAGLGAYEGREVIDASDRWVVPGFIDAHMHLESSKLLVDEFARLVLPFGTTTVVADPHEIANVLGTDGVHWLIDVCADIPLDVYFMASSCVPASSFESPRRELTPGDLDALLRRRRVIGLAEMMNFPGVIGGAPSELAKLALARHVDGHAPGVLGRSLNAYAAAGIGSDHEAYTPEEGRERLRAGMWLLIREATAARNLQALLPLLAEYGPGRIAFCTDDREPEHIADDGHINGMVRDAVAYGIPPEDALVCASLNPALWHGLDGLGAIAPGLPRRPARAARPRALRAGAGTEERGAGRRMAARRGARLGPTHDAHRRVRPRDVPRAVGRRRRARDRHRSRPDRHRLAGGGDPGAGRRGAAPTRRRTWRRSRSSNGTSGTGRVGHGFVRGFGLQRGAIASTVAHDAHNVVVVGMNDASMAAAVRRLANRGGGIVVVDGAEVLAELPLPVAGLLSDAALEEVVAQSHAIVDAVRQLGCTLDAPFQHLSFLALSVIPSLKLTDLGLVDVDRFELVPLAVS